ncbi:MAG: class I SAM-dependent methyltransferase, partial [Bryobacteraceae bacterium]
MRTWVMDSSSIQAYSASARVGAYDADMDLMHPNRHKMADVIVAVLAASERQPEVVVDLGTGTGFLLERILRRFPSCRAIAMDGSGEMIAMAQSRLGSLAGRVEFRIGDFRELGALAAVVNCADAVLSGYALHHLNLQEKARTLGQCRTLLKPGGWFLNADLVIADDDFLESLVQRMRVEGIVDRAQGGDPRFGDREETRRFLDELERKECDQPQRLAEDLRIMQACGFRHVTL